MRLVRIYQNAVLGPGMQIELDENAQNHVQNVLRMKPNDPLSIFDGKGHEFSAFITLMKKKCVLVTLQEEILENRESPLHLHLGQVISRGDKMDYTIQKAVELGVNQITPLMSERSHIKSEDARLKKRMEHWLGIIIHACEQSGRSKLPDLMMPMQLSAWVQAEQFGTNLVLAPNANHTLNMITKPQTKMSVLIGSEGGLTENEIQYAEKNNFLSIRLGPRILRTETAALTTLSLLQYSFGDFT